MLTARNDIEGKTLSHVFKSINSNQTVSTDLTLKFSDTPVSGDFRDKGGVAQTQNFQFSTSKTSILCESLNGFLSGMKQIFSILRTS